MSRPLAIALLLAALAVPALGARAGEDPPPAPPPIPFRDLIFQKNRGDDALRCRVEAETADGVRYTEEGSTRSRVLSWNQVERVHYHDLPKSFRRGERHFKAEEFSQAARAFGNVLASRKDRPWKVTAAFLRAECLYQLGAGGDQAKLTEAITRLGELIQAHPEHPRAAAARLTLIQAQRAAGQLPAARAALEEALVAPGLPAAVRADFDFLAAELTAAAEGLPSARPMFNDISLQTIPERPHLPAKASLRVIQAIAGQGQPDEAEIYLGTLQDQAREGGLLPQAYLARALAELALARGDRSGATLLLARAAALCQGDPEEHGAILNRLGAQLREAGDAEGARAAWALCARIYPRTPWGRTALENSGE